MVDLIIASMVDKVTALIKHTRATRNQAANLKNLVSQNRIQVRAKACYINDDLSTDHEIDIVGIYLSSCLALL